MTDQNEGVELRALASARSDERVRYISKRIVELTWLPGVSDAEAAQAWGMELQEVIDLVNDAGFTLSAAYEAEAARGRLLGMAEGLVSAAIGKRKVYPRRDGSVVESPEPDFNAALKGIELIARMTGVVKERSAGNESHSPADIDELVAKARRVLERRGHDARLRQ